MPGITIDAEVLAPMIRQIVAETLAATRSVRAEAEAPAQADRLLLTPRQAAEAMAISERTLWSLTQPRGDLPCVPLGKRNVRYDPADIQAWIQRHKTGKGAAEPVNSRRNGRPAGVT